MRRWGFIIGVLIITLGLSLYETYSAEEINLYNFFSKTGAEFMRMDTEAQCNIKTSENEEEVAVRLFKALGYETGYELSKDNEMTLLKYRNESREVNIKVRGLEEENLTYASIILSHYASGENINSSIRGTMTKAFEDYKVKPSFSSLISGKYSEKFTPQEMQKSADMVFKSSGARFVKGMNEGNLVSFSGYVKGIRERIKMGNRYINLNIALRYSESNGCTYIWIGSPLIKEEY